MHHADWPTVDELPDGGDSALLADLSNVLMGIRAAKSQAKVKQRTEVTRATVSAPQHSVKRLHTVLDDLKAVGNISGALDLVASEGEIHIDVELAPAAR